MSPAFRYQIQVAILIGQNTGTAESIFTEEPELSRNIPLRPSASLKRSFDFVQVPLGRFKLALPSSNGRAQAQRKRVCFCLLYHAIDICQSTFHITHLCKRQRPISKTVEVRKLDKGCLFRCFYSQVEIVFGVFQASQSKAEQRSSCSDFDIVWIPLQDARKTLDAIKHICSVGAGTQLDRLLISTQCQRVKQYFFQLTLPVDKQPASARIQPCGKGWQRELLLAAGSHLLSCARYIRYTKSRLWRNQHRYIRNYFTAGLQQ
jgi:hypothetical protein